MFVDLDLGQCEELGIYTTMVSILFTDKDHMLTSRCLICFNYDLGTFIDDSETVYCIYKTFTINQYIETILPFLHFLVLYISIEFVFEICIFIYVFTLHICTQRC